MNVLELILNDMLRRTEEGSLARRLLIAGANGYNQRMAEINGKPAPTCENEKIAP